MLTIEKVKEIKEKYTNLLLKRENVIGVGIGKKKRTEGKAAELCINVYVTKKKPKSQLKEIDVVPKELEGVRTNVIETGKIRFLDNKQENGNK